MKDKPHLAGVTVVAGNCLKRDVRVLTRIVSKKHKTTAAQLAAELNLHLNSPVYTKTVRLELNMVKIHGRAAISKPLVKCANAKCPFNGASSENLGLFTM